MVNLLRHRFGVLEKIGVIKVNFNDRRNDMLKMKYSYLGRYKLSAVYHCFITVFMDEYTLDADLIDKGHKACEFFVTQINKLTLVDQQDYDFFMRRIQEPASRIEVAGLSDYPLGEIFAAYEDLMIIMLDHYS